MGRNQVLAIALVAATGCHDGDRERARPVAWSYSSPDWVRDGYAECGGAVESPIDIETRTTVKAALAPIELHYNVTPLDLVDNGHTVMVKVAPGSSMSVNGTPFALEQFHFHRKSEHQIDGAGFEMELHLVNRDARTGNLAVIAVLLR